MLAPRPDTVTGTATWCLRAGLVPRRCSVHLAEQMEALSELREHRLGRRGEPLGLGGKERPQKGVASNAGPLPLLIPTAPPPLGAAQAPPPLRSS